MLTSDQRKWFTEQVDEAQRLLVRLHGSLRTEKLTHNMAEPFMVATDIIDTMNRIVAEIESLQTE